MFLEFTFPSSLMVNNQNALTSIIVKGIINYSLMTSLQAVLSLAEVMYHT